MVIEGVDYQFKRLFKLKELAQLIVDRPKSNYKHFAFIMRGSKIISIGWNDVNYGNVCKVHGQRVQYPLGGIHAECHAIAKLPDIEVIRRSTMVSLRISPQGGFLRNAYPCKVCMQMIKDFGFKKLYYSTDTGFIKEKV